MGEKTKVPIAPPLISILKKPAAGMVASAVPAAGHCLPIRPDTGQKSPAPAFQAFF